LSREPESSLFATGGAISGDFQSRHHDPEPAVFLHLPLESLENIAHEFQALARAQTSQVDVIPVQLALVIMILAMDVHEVRFVDQPVPLQQLEGAADRAATHAGIQLLGLAQELGGIQVFGRNLHHAQDGAPRLRHPDSALREVGLETARHFRLR
jgi:hypothetical protein